LASRELCHGFEKEEFVTGNFLGNRLSPHTFFRFRVGRTSPLPWLLFLLFLIPGRAEGLDCNSPPRGFGGSWARSYESWCRQCGGRYNSSNQSCTPGPNWGGGSQGGPSYAPPAYDYEAERQRQEAERQRQLEAERQRQQELEEQRKQEEEAAKKKQEDFERAKQDALGSIKGISENELGLKGVDAGGSGLKDIGDTGTSGLGLKDLTPSITTTQPKKADCEWGNMGSSVVDLRCLGLDPNKPIFVDPRVVKGQTRGYPAQIDPATFRNVDYNKGFEALMRFDVASASDAVGHFKKAESERPNDPLVHNGLLLAQDILKARRAKEREKNALARHLTKECAAALLSGEMEKARDYIARARDLAPDNHDIEMYQRVVGVIAKEAGPQSPPETKTAYKLFVHGAYAMAAGNDSGAQRILQAAHDLAPQDRNIAEYLRQVREYREDTERELKPMDPEVILKGNKP